MSKSQKHFQFTIKGGDGGTYFVVFFKLFKLKKHTQRHAYCVNSWSLENGFIGGICYLELEQYPKVTDAQAVFPPIYEKYLGRLSQNMGTKGELPDVTED